MAGMPCAACGCEPPCSFAEGELPNLAITGMHSYTGWSIAGCCASMEFEYDTEQPYVKYDGGDVMSFDKTTLKTVEAFYYPETCGQRLKGWVIAANSSGYPGDHFYPTEPAYTGCCPDPVTLNTITLENRIRGGRRFVLRLRPTKTKITIQKATVKCGSVTSAKYVVTSEKSYVGVYEYVDYQQVSWTQRNSSGKDCWKISDVTTGVFPFDISAWNPSASAVSIGFSFCARLNLDTLPSDIFTFSVGQTGSACESPIPNCAPCNFKSEVCFDSGLTGITEPSTGFCTPPTIGTQSYTLTHTPRCRQHRWALFDRGNAPAGEGGHIFPGILRVGNGCLPFAGTTYPPANCVRNFSYVGIVGGGIVPASSYYTGSLEAPNCDVWSLTCGLCYSYSDFNPTYETDDPGTSTENYKASNALARVVAASVSLTCSGYVRRTICVAFSTWRIAVV